MSLRLRVMALIAAVLVLGVGCAALLLAVEARRTLHAELAAGLDGGVRTVESAFEDLPRSDHADRDLRQLVRTFDANRHVRASLVDPEGRTLLASSPLVERAGAPAWFAKSLGTPPPPRAVAVTDAAHAGWTLELSPTPDLDTAGLWREFAAVVLLLGLFVVLALALTYLAMGAALKPLGAMAQAFARIGAGDYGQRVLEGGPPDLRRLETAFNRMAGELAAMDRRNRDLEKLLVEIQEEERADLARDLHDELGPQLFAVRMDAELARQDASSHGLAPVVERLGSIQAATGRMQAMVREMLRRLRPAQATELGLRPALEEMARFWRERSPATDIVLELSLVNEEELSGDVRETLYRVVHEAVGNAVRHAAPSRIVVAVRSLGDGVAVEVRDDGKAQQPGDGLGLGLVGMRERVRACGGELVIDRSKAGWTVSARLPAAAPAGLPA